jgi:hypothetical protein
MLEILSSFLNTETAKIVVPAVIGALTAIITILIKDIILYEIRERKKERKALVDRKLTQLYGPIYFVCVTGESSITSLLQDDSIYEKLIGNLHLLSPELQKLLNEYNSLGRGSYRDPQFSLENRKKALEISSQFSKRLEHEMNTLRRLYK